MSDAAGSPWSARPAPKAGKSATATGFTHTTGRRRASACALDEEGEKLLQKAMTIEPDNADVRYALAVFVYRADQKRRRGELLIFGRIKAS